MDQVDSVAGVIFSLDRSAILLTQRRDVPVWVLPGGGVNPNESPKDAIVREILEETGFTVKVTRLVGHYLPINRLARPTDLYECEIIEGKPMLSSETQGIQFFPLDRLPKRLPPFYKEWINDSIKPGPPFCKNLSSITYAAFFFHWLRHPILMVRFLFSRMGWPINTPSAKQQQGENESE